MPRDRSPASRPSALGASRAGLLGPGEFIPIAEDAGLIVPIGTWVLAEAVRQWASWREHLAGAAGMAMAVNLSARQLRDHRLLGTVRTILSHYGMPPSALTFELTESVLMDDL